MNPGKFVQDDKLRRVLIVVVDIVVSLVEGSTPEFVARLATFVDKGERDQIGT